MKTFVSILIVAVAYFALSTNAFVIPQQTSSVSQQLGQKKTRVNLNIGDQERTQLTRDSEPEDFFQTNTDKMTDQEKLPIAIAGVAFICVPFIAGLIALYSAK